MKTAELVAILRAVPTKELKLVKLVNELMEPNGKLDYAQVAKRQAEINMAKMQAQAYTRATVQAIQALANIHARPEGED